MKPKSVKFNPVAMTPDEISKDNVIRMFGYPGKDYNTKPKENKKAVCFGRSGSINNLKWFEPTNEGDDETAGIMEYRNI